VEPFVEGEAKMSGAYFRRELRGKPNFLPQAGPQDTRMLQILSIYALPFHKIKA
jgi:hypothetical protein